MPLAKYRLSSPCSSAEVGRGAEFLDRLMGRRSHPEFEIRSLSLRLPRGIGVIGELTGLVLSAVSLTTAIWALQWVGAGAVTVLVVLLLWWLGRLLFVVEMLPVHELLLQSPCETCYGRDEEIPVSNKAVRS
jgi:hypothetical protein